MPDMVIQAVYKCSDDEAFDSLDDAKTHELCHCLESTLQGVDVELAEKLAAIIESEGDILISIIKEFQDLNVED